MEWAFLLFIIVLLIDIEDKIRKMNRNNFLNVEEKKISNLTINEYKDKKVSIVLKDVGMLSDELNNTKVIGEIIDFDNEWIVYQHNTKKEKITRYIRISYIESIDEIK